MSTKFKARAFSSILACSVVALGAIGTTVFVKSHNVKTITTTGHFNETYNEIKSSTHNSVDKLSYYTSVLNPEKKVYFDSSSAPIENFCYENYDNGCIWINGLAINTNNITSITFGDSYSNVTSTGNWFLDGCHGRFQNISSLDFSGLKNLYSFGHGCLMGYNNGGFKKMTSIYTGDVTFPTIVGGGFCEDFPATGTIYGSKASTWLKLGIKTWNVAPTPN